jgi:hypothetical protein
LWDIIGFMVMEYVLSIKIEGEEQNKVLAKIFLDWAKELVSGKSDIQRWGKTSADGKVVVEIARTE